MTKGLSDRVAATRETSSEVVRREPTLIEQVEQMNPEFQKAMPRGNEATMLVRDAITVIRKAPGLARCSPASVLGGLMNVAQLGLRVGVLGHAWLLPLNGKNGLEAQLILGYQGMIELAHRTGRIESLVARTVYENDEFDVDYGLADNLVHKPRMDGDRGDPIAYYAIAKYHPKGHVFWVMTQKDMEDHRDRFAMAKKGGQIVGPWRDHFESMALKTTIRALAKFMPKSTDTAFAVGLEADETIRLDARPEPLAALEGRHVTPQDGYEPAGDEEDGGGEEQEESSE